jgi:hypothetical protein
MRQRALPLFDTILNRKSPALKLQRSADICRKKPDKNLYRCSAPELAEDFIGDFSGAPGFCEGKILAELAIVVFLGYILGRGRGWM